MFQRRPCWVPEDCYRTFDIICSMENRHRGSCLCGAIGYSFTGDVQEYGFCHCKSCRKASGSAFSANASVDASSFEVDDSRSYLKEYESSPGTHRFFCSNCGSPLFSKIDDTPEFIRVRLGTLDTIIEKRPSKHTFVSEKAPWYNICDEAPQFQQKAS